MKITINNKTTTIDLTKHKWTLEKQFDKFLEEWEEFKTAYKIDHSLTFDKYKHDVIQEGLDVIKSGHKYVLMINKDVLDEFLLDSSISHHREMFDVAEMTIQNFIKDNANYTKGNLAIFNMVCFLKEFCLENDEDLIEHIKINNDKTNSRGDARKVYFIEGEEEMLKQVSAFCKENKKEGFGIDIDELLKRVED